MPNKKFEEVPKELIDGLQAFLKFYEYGCHMLDGLAERHLSGEDIVPQICALQHNDGVKGIFFLIRCSDKMAEVVLGGDLVDEDGCRKLSDIRSKYCPILEDVLNVGEGVFSRGEVNPISSARFKHRYVQEDETLYLDVTAVSGQREIFRVMQDALELFRFALAIVSESSDSFELYERQGLPLSEPSIKQLEQLQKELQNSSAKLSKVVQNYLSAEKQAQATTD